MTTALTLPEGTALQDMYRAENGVDPLISRIEEMVRSHVADVSTKKGRDAVASLAHNVSKSKVLLDGAGKKMTEDAKREIAVVDAARKKIRDRLDALRDEARAPLTAWERAEEKRIDDAKSALAEVRRIGADADDASEVIAAQAARIKAVHVSDDWPDYRDMIETARAASIDALRGLYAAAKRREDQDAEIARLRAENDRMEADRAAAEAEKQRIAEAELAAAQAEADRIAQEEAAKQAEAAAKAESDRIEREKAEAAAWAAKEATERAASEAAAREEELRRQISEQAARAEAAAKAERDRIAAERLAEDQARAKREADQAHRAKIAGDIADALRTMSGRATPEAIADALISGKIPHCTVRM